MSKYFVSFSQFFSKILKITNQRLCKVTRRFCKYTELYYEKKSVTLHRQKG